MRYSSIAALFFLTGVAATLVYAEEPRHHEAHEHGGGQLNVAVEQGTLMIDLSLPAMNVVGFEHPAHNKNERDQVAQAADLLRDGMRLFAPAPAAKCVLTKSEVESALLGNAGHHDDENGRHEDEGEGNGHADFDVSYEFNCHTPTQLDSLTLSLFDRFPGTHHLRTQVITSSGQAGIDLTDENKVLKLK
jgi:hypothetical protein